MDFGEAIKLLKEGKKVARAGWNGKNQYIELAICISYKNVAGEIVNCEHEVERYTILGGAFNHYI